VAVLLVVTVLATLAAPHVRTVRELVAGGLAELPAIGRPGRAPTTSDRSRADRAVAFALAQRGKPYRWGAEGPDAFDCSGLTWAAWRAAGVAIPRTAAGQLGGLPRARGRLRAGDLLIYPSRGPSGRHVAMVVGRGRMVEALGRGIPVRVTGIRGGWLGAVRPGAGRRPPPPWTSWAEQATALAGAGLGLTVWLLARALFGGRRRR
jgi:cell wall-associated NlpC family hydrolase